MGDTAWGVLGTNRGGEGKGQHKAVVPPVQAQGGHGGWPWGFGVHGQGEVGVG